MSNKEEKKTHYTVIIFRNDNNHISLMETSNYDKAMERWLEVKKLWSEAIKEKTPFEIKDPVVTVFDPGLITEITLRPVASMPESKYENPYHKKMVKEGFSNTFGGSEILDKGYL